MFAHTQKGEVWTKRDRMTRSCLVTKKIGVNHKQDSLGGFVTDFYAPIWVMGFRAFYH